MENLLNLFLKHTLVLALLMLVSQSLYAQQESIFPHVFRLEDGDTDLYVQNLRPDRRSAPGSSSIPPSTSTACSRYMSKNGGLESSRASCSTN